MCDNCSNCTGCNQSSFFPYRKAKVFSNVTGAELRAQCAQENGLDINDPANQYVIDACVTAKSGGAVNQKGQQVLGWMTGIGNILQNASQILSGVTSPQPPPAGTGYAMPPQEQKSNIGTILLVLAGIGLLIGVGYMAFKKSKQGNDGK